MRNPHDYLQEKESPRFLLIRLKPIGDTVLLTPVFRNIKRLYPAAQIDVVVYPFVKDVLADNPYIDNVIVLERTIVSKVFFYIKSLFRRYDVVIDFINNPTSAAIAFCTPSHYLIGGRNRRTFFYNHRIRDNSPVYSAIRCLKKLDTIGLEVFSDYYTEVFVNSGDKMAARLYFASFPGDEPVIGIFASAKYPSKTYPASHFAEVGLRLAEEKNVRVLYLFGKGDEHTYETIRSRVGGHERIMCHPPDTTLGYLCGLLSMLDFLVIGDTGPKHIASALGIPTLTIFSASNEKVWNPPDRVRFPVIRKNLSCSPCNSNTCPLVHRRCMTELDHGDVCGEALHTMYRLGVLKEDSIDPVLI